MSRPTVKVSLADAPKVVQPKVRHKPRNAQVKDKQDSPAVDSERMDRLG